MITTKDILLMDEVKINLKYFMPDSSTIIGVDIDWEKSDIIMTINGEINSLTNYLRESGIEL